MKKLFLCLMVMGVFSVSVYAETTIDRSKYEVTIDRVDGTFLGGLIHWFTGDYSSVKTEYDDVNKKAKTTCYGGGFQECKAGKINVGVPVGVPVDIYDTMEMEIGNNIFNGELTGEIFRKFYNKETQKKIIFIATWEGKNIRNNKIVFKNYDIVD